MAHWSPRGRFSIANIRILATLRYGAAAHRAVQGPRDNAPPGKDDERDEGESGSDADEDRAFGEVGFLHVGRIGGRGNAGGRVVIAGELGKAGLEAAEIGRTGGEGGEAGSFCGRVGGGSSGGFGGFGSFGRSSGFGYFGSCFAGGIGAGSVGQGGEVGGCGSEMEMEREEEGWDERRCEVGESHFVCCGETQAEENCSLADS